MVKSYRSYLLRLWRASTVAGMVWRGSLEEIPTGERIAFASLEDLLSHLREETEDSSHPERTSSGADGVPSHRSGPT